MTASENTLREQIDALMPYQENYDPEYLTEKLVKLFTAAMETARADQIEQDFSDFMNYGFAENYYDELKEARDQRLAELVGKGSPQDSATPKAQGHKADNLSAESAGKETA